MAEIRASFNTSAEWKSWGKGLGDVAVLRSAIVTDIRTRGYTEPFTGLARFPHQINIRDNDLHESISSNELNSRKRALLVQIILEFQTRNWLARRNLRILGAEALSRSALILRGQFPFYLGTEYLPDQESQKNFFPIVHMDLQQIEYPNESFDVFISGDVLEHVPDLDQALRHVYRILKPGGVIISTFPFDPNRDKTLLKASIDGAGRVINHTEPEYHGNPVSPSEGSLVYQLPGWDVLPQLLAIGFEDAYFSIIASSHFGIASSSLPGVFVLTASKQADNQHPGRRPPPVVIKSALPDRLCALIALPRSGTTMLTSVFAVHSKCEAVYEPWNGKSILGVTESLIEAIAKAENLPSLAGKMLFVKETTACDSSMPGLQRLFATTPFPVEKHMLMLLRQPEHTFLSEIERRNEWWKDDVTVNEATFESWAAKSALAVREMLSFGKVSNGTVVLLEDFAEHPEVLLMQLAHRLGFAVEPNQLEYEKHLDKSRVRGDVNVSENPERITVSATVSRADRIVDIEKLAAASRHAAWFEEFGRLYSAIHEQGGIMGIREIPRSVLEALCNISGPAS